MPQKQSDISLVPYVCLDGRWTVSDSVLDELFHGMEDDSTLDRVFYEGHVQTTQQLKELLQNPTAIPVIIGIGDRPVGFAWLNGQSGHTAFAHFCFLKRVWGRESLEAGNLLLKYWMSLSDEEGGIFDVLIGVIPKFNSVAIEFAQRVGFQMLGVIPGMGRRPSGERLSSAILYYARQ